MADVKISDLPASTLPLSGTEVLPIVQSGVTKQVTVSDLTSGRFANASSLSVGNTTDPGASNLSVTGNIGGTFELLTDNFAVGFGKNIAIGPSQFDNLRLNLWSNASGGSNIALQGNAASGGTGVSPKLYFGDSTYAYAYVGGVYSTTGSTASGSVVFGTTPNLSTTAITERMRIFPSGGVSIGNTTDKGAATLNVSGLIFPQQAATAPAYVKGAIYFDTTLNKLRVGGATAWETITSV
jgi:hypothetical protein